MLTRSHGVQRYLFKRDYLACKNDPKLYIESSVFVPELVIYFNSKKTSVDLFQYLDFERNKTSKVSYIFGYRKTRSVIRFSIQVEDSSYCF